MSGSTITGPRRPEGVEARSMGWWGTLLLAAVIITSYAGMYFTYIYVRVSNEAWPPAGIDPPELGLAGLAAVALLASAPAVAIGTRRAAVRGWVGVRIALVAALLLGGAHVGLLIADWVAAPFSVDTHAYASLYYALPGIHAVVVVIGMLIAAVLAALTWHADGPALVYVGATCLRVYWYTAVLGGVGLLLVVYVLPHVWREAIAP